MQSFEVKYPHLWDIETPNLYTAGSTLKIGETVVDEYETRFGIRSITFDKDKGFFINGRHCKLNGVCMHHDLGPLGTAVNTRCIERQLELLKDMGCNAIRTSHNPPAPQLLDLCDEMGLVVIDEAFDEWATGKVDNGYNKHFQQWAEKDMRAMIRRDGNHPCGIPKDRFSLYRSHWSDAPTLHLLPHWNWEGREGERTPVHCYTSFNRAELFVNGHSKGIREKNPDKLYERYRLIWDDVMYEPGYLKVVAYDEQGNPALTHQVKTAGAPAALDLQPDRTQINADGEDLCFITTTITDAESNFHPTADNLILFSVEGPGEIAAVGNGDATSTEPFMNDRRSAFNGQCMLIIRAAKKAGNIKVKAESNGLKAATVTLSAVSTSCEE